MRKDVVCVITNEGKPMRRHTRVVVNDAEIHGVSRVAVDIDATGRRTLTLTFVEFDLKMGPLDEQVRFNGQG